MDLSPIPRTRHAYDMGGFPSFSSANTPTSASTPSGAMGGMRYGLYNERVEGKNDMKTILDLPQTERAVLEELRVRIGRAFPDWTFRMTLFGSRARGEAEPDSDMDVLLDIEQDHISFAEKQRIRRAAGEVSLESGIVLSLLIVDRHVRKERGDFSVFQNIREEGIPV